MKKLYTFIIVILLLLGGGYFFLNEYAPKTLDNIRETVQSTIQNIDFVQQDIGGDLIAGINTNLESNLAMVIKAPNGEGISVFTKTVGNKEYVDQIVFVNKDGKAGLVQVDELGLPVKLTFEGYTATFDNYTEDMKVDITVVKPDGSTELLKSQSFKPDKSTALNFIMPAYANYEQYRWIAEINQKPMSRAERFAMMNELASIGDEMDNLANYLKQAPGLVINILGCGAGIGVTLYSAGATSPLAYLGCGALAVRLTTLNTEIGKCKGDILTCGAEAVNDFMTQATQGARLIGIVRDKETQKIIRDYDVRIEKSNSVLISDKKIVEFDWFRLGHLESGAYYITLSKKKYISKRIKVVINNDRARIIDTENNKTVFDKRINKGYYFHFFTDLEPGVNFDGTWTGKAKTLIAGVGEDVECGGASLLFSIANYEICGSAEADMGYSLDIDGIVEKNGKINGGMAIGRTNAAGFAGQLKEDGTGSGTWEDNHGCYGTFELTKKED